MFQFRAFPPYTYFIQCTVSRYCRDGFPHSEISGSMRMCRSPELFAACHVLLRLLMPRHSPCALISLTIVGSAVAACDASQAMHQRFAPAFLLLDPDPLRWALNQKVSGSHFELCRSQKNFYRSNCSCYPIIPQYFLLTALRCHTLCCLASSHHFSLCSVFKVQIEDVYPLN